MKKVQLGLIAMQIEYHWWWIVRLRSNPKKSRLVSFHRLCADQLQIRYQIVMGLRDQNGQFCR